MVPQLPVHSHLSLLTLSGTLPFDFSCSSLVRADLQTWSMSLSRSCQRFPLKQVCTWPRKVRFCFLEYVWENRSSKASRRGSKICLWSTGLYLHQTENNTWCLLFERLWTNRITECTAVTAWRVFISQNDRWYLRLPEHEICRWWKKLLMSVLFMYTCMSLTLQADRQCHSAGSCSQLATCVLNLTRNKEYFNQWYGLLFKKKTKKTLYLWTSGTIWNSGQHVDSSRLGGTAHLGSWAHLWLWPGVEQWRSSQFLSLPPEEQAHLWLHTPPAVPAALKRDVWQQMSGSPCSWGKKKERKISKCVCWYWCHSQAPSTMKYNIYLKSATIF